MLTWFQNTIMQIPQKQNWVVLWGSQNVSNRHGINLEYISRMFVTAKKKTLAFSLNMRTGKVCERGLENTLENI